MPEETKEKDVAQKPAKAKEIKVIQKPANCMKCNKHLQKKSWYYRNSGYYCSKRCWKLATSKKKEKKES